MESQVNRWMDPKREGRWKKLVIGSDGSGPSQGRDQGKKVGKDGRIQQEQRIGGIEG